jgi:hypothetical protein
MIPYLHREVKKSVRKKSGAVLRSSLRGKGRLTYMASADCTSSLATFFQSIKITWWTENKEEKMRKKIKVFLKEAAGSGVGISHDFGKLFLTYRKVEVVNNGFHVGPAQLLEISLEELRKLILAGYLNPAKPSFYRKVPKR